MSKHDTWKMILHLVISVLTAIATTLSVTSRMKGRHLTYNIG